MKKNKKTQSVKDCNVTNNSNNNVTNNSNNNVTNKSNNNVTNRSNSNIGFENETKSFQLDENDEHSFELK